MANNITVRLLDDNIIDVSLAITENPSMGALVKGLEELYLIHNRVIYIDQGIRFSNQQMVLAAVWLEVIIPVLVSNELNNTLTDTMLELIDHLNTLAPTLVEVIDDDTNARLDTDVVSLRFKVGRVYGALPSTILTEEDMKSLIRKRSKLMNVLWLYSNFYTIIHQADYELRSIEGFHSARIH